MYQIEYWIKKDEIIDTSSLYWSNEENEKGKEWDIVNGDFSKMESYVDRSGLKFQLLNAINFLQARVLAGQKIKGADLAAGNSWCAPFFFAQLDIETLYCLEYSKHRIEKLSPTLLEHYKVDPGKMKLVHGSFYDLKLQDESLDFVLLCQAFHHASEPDLLLKEINRVLKKNGILLIIGEPRMYFVKSFVKNFVKYVLNKLLPETILKRIDKRKEWRKKVLFPSHEQLFPTDCILGDHYYDSSSYIKFLKNRNFLLLKSNFDKDLKSFYAEKINT